MSKFNFDHAEDDILSVRIRKDVAGQIRQIAKEQRVSIQEVCRTFLTVSVKEYEAEAVSPPKEQQ